MEVTGFSEQDIPALAPLQPPGWRDLGKAFSYYLSGPHCHPVKVVEGDTIVAVGATIHFERTAWLGHIIVHPEFRRRGIGRMLVASLLERLRLAAIATVSLVATDDGYPLYLSMGFAPVASYVFYDADDPARSDPHAPAVTPARAGDLEGMIALDSEVTGEARGALYTGQLATALVHRTNHGIDGVYCPSLGEGFIAATAEEAGASLLAVHLSTTTKVVLPEANLSGARHIKNAGFRETRRSTRMVLGEPYSWRPECVYSRIGGFLG